MMFLAAKSEEAFLTALTTDMIDVNDMSQGTPMLSFAIANDLDKAALAILERKPNLQLADRDYGMTALHAAVSKGKTDLVRALLEAGAGESLNKPFGPEGGPQWMCLAIAVKKRNLELIQILLQAGAQADCDIRPDAADPMDRKLTPLTAAAAHGDLELMRLLIAHGANVNYWPPSTMSPLMHAAIGGKTEAARLLVESGAIIELHSNALNANAYAIARHRGHKELADFLYSRSERIREAYPQNA